MADKDINIHVNAKADAARQKLDQVADSTKKVGSAGREGSRGMEQLNASATKSEGLFSKLTGKLAGMVAGVASIQAVTRAIQAQTRAMEENAAAATKQQNALVRLQFLGDYYKERPDLRKEVAAMAEFGRRPFEDVASAMYNLRSKNAAMSESQRMGIMTEALEMGRTDPSLPLDTLVDMFSLYGKQSGVTDANRIQNVLQQTITEAGGSGADVASYMPRFLPVGMAGGPSAAPAARPGAYGTTQESEASVATTGLRAIMMGLQGKGTPEGAKLLEKMGVTQDMGFFAKIDLLSRQNIDLGTAEQLFQREGAAMALENAALQASIEGGHEFSAVYLRLAYALVPDDETLLNVGVSLAEGRLEVAARNTFARIGPEAGRYYVEARIQSALSYQEEDRSEEALVELNRAFAAAPQDPRIAYLLAGQLADMERYEEALALAYGPLLNTADQDFSVRFLRAGLYDALGRLDEAEAELWAALQARPDDPNILNYLGYIWVDSGRRIDQGAELIARAAEIDPGNANIQDSLGWARYQQGRYDQAVGILEGAVDGEPANAVINDHLGDAYWQVGRRREAVFQWNRVLTLEPDAELRAAVEDKLDGGLPPQTTGSTDGSN